MLRPIRLPVALSAAALCAVLALPAAGVAAPVARAAASCTTTPSSLAGGYVIPGKNKGVSCANRRSLESGYQACRLKHGQKGTCKSKVVGFTCKEGHRSSSPDSFFAVVTCKKGGQSFAWTYEQNTLS
ncbi:MAG TPA: hypothetical protein VG165_17980 [Solirubrobacteraceae bacterium]|jgi:hypothetical protein|nr:hypothetical protein [Solirubrobacteraceae bacterium]